jgi:hypothetical protein
MKDKETGRPYVIKRMSKSELLERANSVSAQTELEFLALAANSALYDGRPAPGIVALHVCAALLFCEISWRQ